MDGFLSRYVARLNLKIDVSIDILIVTAIDIVNKLLRCLRTFKVSESIKWLLRFFRSNFTIHDPLGVCARNTGRKNEREKRLKMKKKVRNEGSE